MVIDAAMTGGLALLMEPIFDKVFAGSESSHIWPVAFAIFACFTIRGFATYIHTLQMNHIGQGVIATIQKQLYAHLVGLDVAYFHSTTTGRLVSSMVNDVNMMRTAVADCLTAIGKNTITLIFLIALMFKQDWVLASCSFFAFPLLAFFVARMGKRLRKVSRSTQSESGAFATLLQQTFQGIRHVKAYTMEEQEQKHVATVIDSLFSLNMKSFRIAAFSGPVMEVLSAIAIVTIVVYGGYQIMSGTRTAGELMSFITAFLLAYEPMKRMAKLNANLQAGLAAADRTFRILEIEPSIQNKPNAKKLKVTDYSIHFNNVSFSYETQTDDEKSIAALDNVSFDIHAGKMVALVGTSGAGKSTILNLIPRFYDVSDGSVSIGNTDIKDVTLESLRQKIALVSQEIALFDDTIFNNIKYGKIDATEAEIISSAKSAAAHDFIMTLPHGYQTKIGENGVRLSGGQRQRIAIARAMLKNAPILLLDEATSALDTESERAVQQALQSLQKGRTTLVIAHRLSTIVEADYIYVLEKGKIIESGTHRSLLTQKGTYAKLYGLQEKEPQA
jgi:subfamily B ATP-binding cassette protein MsbA